jgi:hypothetical protein
VAWCGGSIAAIVAEALAMDLRFPVAILFLLLGGILTLYGLINPWDAGQVDLGLPVNLIWGLVMCGFGAILGGLARRARGRRRLSRTFGMHSGNA